MGPSGSSADPTGPAAGGGAGPGHGTTTVSIGFFYPTDAQEGSTHCPVATMAEGDVEAQDANSAGLLAFTCDGWWFLDAALEAGGGAQLSPQSFLAGEESLGTSYLPATTHSTRFGPGRHDGVGSVRYFAFVDDCECFHYTTAKIPI